MVEEGREGEGRGGESLKGKHVVASTLLLLGGREHVVGDLVAIVGGIVLLLLVITIVVGLNDGEGLLVDVLILVLLELIDLDHSVGLLNKLGVRDSESKIDS